MRKKIFKGTILIFTLAHLTMVTLSASYIKIDWIFAKPLMEFYQKASGADSSYGFFAPTIGGKTRAVFDVIEKDGTKKINIPLIHNSIREEEIRMGGIFDEFISKDARDPSYRNPLAASLAAAMFSKDRDAVEVILHVQEFWSTTIAEYQRGQKAEWTDFYVARFTRGEKPGWNPSR